MFEHIVGREHAVLFHFCLMLNAIEILGSLVPLLSTLCGSHAGNKTNRFSTGGYAMVAAVCFVRVFTLCCDRM